MYKEKQKKTPGQTLVALFKGEIKKKNNKNGQILLRNLSQEQN